MYQLLLFTCSPARAQQSCGHPELARGTAGTEVVPEHFCVKFRQIPRQRLTLSPWGAGGGSEQGPEEHQVLLNSGHEALGWGWHGSSRGFPKDSRLNQAVGQVPWQVSPLPAGLCCIGMESSARHGLKQGAI